MPITDSSNAFSGFDALFAIDLDPLTDYASNSIGLDTFLTFDFGQSLVFTSISYTDRVTSGGLQGQFFGGTADFVTGYTYIFSVDATFGNGDDQTVSVSGLEVPVSPSSPGDFLSIASIPNLTARYVRWDVDSDVDNTNNFEASDFSFVVVPEVGSLTMSVLTLAVGLLGLRIRKK